MRRLSGTVLVAVGLLLLTLSYQGLANASPPGRSHRLVCGTPAAHEVACAAAVITNSLGTPLASSTPPTGSYGPAQFHTAYNLPTTATKSQTIAIVDAYQDPNVESDLGVYDAQYGLPACTSANGCLKIINLCQQWKYRSQKGCGTFDADWAMEIALDVEVAHGICQSCKILLVEADSSNWSDLTTAEATAAQNGATEISNSWGGPEWNGETADDPYWNHPGIATVFSTGDSGYGTEYPSVAPSVIAAAGTTLSLNANNTYAGEAAWNGSGSGCSSYEPANSWELALPDWTSTGCGTARADGDVAADADPSTGAAIYDSYGSTTNQNWYQVGGTSLAAPLIASTFALAGGVAGIATPAQIPYTRLNASNSHDVTTGANGTCATIMCVSGAGYDGPTGLGSPNGTSGF